MDGGVGCRGVDAALLERPGDAFEEPICTISFVGFEKSYLLAIGQCGPPGLEGCDRPVTGQTALLLLLGGVGTEEGGVGTGGP